VSVVIKNTLRIVVDNTNPIFDLQPATTVNVRVNSPIATTVYDAHSSFVVAVYIVVDVAVSSILTSMVVELVNSDFVVSMTIDEVSLTLVTLKQQQYIRQQQMRKKLLTL
jgi:hypothetical protein